MGFHACCILKINSKFGTDGKELTKNVYWTVSVLKCNPDWFISTYYFIIIWIKSTHHKNLQPLYQRNNFWWFYSFKLQQVDVVFTLMVASIWPPHKKIPADHWPYGDSPRVGVVDLVNIIERQKVMKKNNISRNYLPVVEEYQLGFFPIFM